MRRAKHLLVLKSVSSFWPDWQLIFHLRLYQNFTSRDISHCCSEEFLIPIWLCSLIQLPNPGTNPIPGQLLLPLEAGVFFLVIYMFDRVYIPRWGYWRCKGFQKMHIFHTDTLLFNRYLRVLIYLIQKYHLLLALYFLDFCKPLCVLKILCQWLYLFH